MNTKQLFLVFLGCFLQLLTIGKVWGQQKNIKVSTSANLLSNTCSVPAIYTFSTSGSTTGYQPDSILGSNSSVTLHYYWGDGSVNTVIKTSLYGDTTSASYYNQQPHSYAQGTYKAKIVAVAPDSLADSVLITVNVSSCKVISGQVYADLNQNCSNDGGDMLLPNVGLSCYGIQFSSTTTTDQSGMYAFSVPDNGNTYTVRVTDYLTNSSGSSLVYKYITCSAGIDTINSLPATGKDFAFKQAALLTHSGNNPSITSCDSTLNVAIAFSARTIGFAQNSSFNAHIYFGDGKDAILTYNNASTYDTLGFYFAHQYSGVGQYNMKVVLNSPNGPSDSLFYTSAVTLSACGLVEGKVYADTNANCLFDSAVDVLKQNIGVSLLDANKNVVGFTTTDIKGHYSFNVIDQSKTYTISLNNAIQVTCPANSTYTISTFPSSGNDFAIKDTLSNTTSAIAGKVYKDQNNNCTYDSSEMLLQNVQVQLLNASHQLLQTTYTNYYGQYKFNVVQGQSYMVALSKNANCTSSYVINNLPTTGKDFASFDTTHNSSKGVHANWGFHSINSCNAMFDFYPAMEVDSFKLGDSISAKFIYGDGHDTTVIHLVANIHDTLGFHFKHQYGAIGSYTLKFIVSGPNGSNDSAVYVNGVTIGNCGIISGKVYVDENTNCTFDGNDMPLGYATLRLLDSNNNVLAYNYTQPDGSYNFNTPDINHTYTVVINDSQNSSSMVYNAICPASNSYAVNTFPAVNKDFAIKRGVDLTSLNGYPGSSCTIPSPQAVGINYGSVGYSSGNVLTFKIAFGDGSDTTFTQNDSTGNFGYTRYLSVNHNYRITGKYSVQIILTATDGATDTITQYNTFNISDSCAAISGRVFLDANADCSYNGSDTPMQYKFVVLLDNGNYVDYAYTDYLGNYYFTVSKNSGHAYKVKFLADTTHSYKECPATGEIIINSLPSSGNDFALTCNAGYDLAGVISGWGFKPGYNAYFDFNAYNKRCTGVYAAIKLVKSPLLTIINSNPAADAIVGDTLVWYKNNFTNADNFYAHIDVLTSTGATLNDSIAGKLIFEPIANDSMPSDNVVNYVFPIKNSWDPNMKSAAAADGNTKRKLIPLNTKELTYTVFFQNTGNDAAYNIFVIDTLDSSIDPSSVQIVNQSHKMKADMLPGNILKFNFNNIMLPNSKSNEPASHGFVTYKASLKPGLSKGTIINNTGYIYFDYNSAIITNTTQNQLAQPLGVAHVIAANNSITTYPNPANNQLTVFLNNDIIGGKVSVVDMLGNILVQQTAENRLMQLNTSLLPAGIYLLMINKGAFNSKTKISVLH